MPDSQGDAGRGEPGEVPHRPAGQSEPGEARHHPAEPSGPGEARGSGGAEPAAGRHREAGRGGGWRRWGAAHWTIAVSSVFALAMLAILVLLAVFRGRTGCGGRAGQAPATSPSPSSSTPAAGQSGGPAETGSCGCGGTSCFDPGEVCGRILDDTCNSLVSGCGGSGGREPDSARSDDPVGPVETTAPGAPGGTAGPGDDRGGPTEGGDPTGGDRTGDDRTGGGPPGDGDSGGGDSGDEGGGSGSGGDAGSGSGAGDSSGCDSGPSDSCSGGDGCSGGSGPDCSGYVPGHGVSGSLLVVAPVVLAAPGVGARLGVMAVRAYQRWLSPRLAVRCRYTPTCSQYGLVAIERYGLLAGARLAQARIRRCTDRVPPGSHDPVPVTEPRRR